MADIDMGYRPAGNALSDHLRSCAECREHVHAQPPRHCEVYSAIERDLKRNPVPQRRPHMEPWW